MLQAPALRFIAIATLTFAFAGCSKLPDTNTDNGSSSSPSRFSSARSDLAASSASSSRLRSSAAKSSLRSSASSSPQVYIRTITVNAENWKFEPSSINVKKGERIRLALKSIEGVHGFAVPGLNINVSVNAGETVYVDIPTAISGTFDFFCSVPCGPGHADMSGSIVIS